MTELDESYVEDLLRDAMHEQAPHLALPPGAAARALRARTRRRTTVGTTALGITALVGVAIWLVVSTQPARSVRITEGPAVLSTGSSPYDQAVAETKRLVALAPVPVSAMPLAHAPAILAGPVDGVPNTTALVTSTRAFRVPMSVADSETYVKAHPPAGLGYEGGGRTYSGPDGEVFGFAYGSSDTSSAWTNAELEIGITALDEHTSAWRIDGLAIVLDQKPLPDTATGPRLHVTVAQGCPRSDRGIVGVSNDAAGLDRALLPPGEPSAALVCAYQGLNGTPFALLAHRTVDAATAERLAGDVRTSPLSHPAGGAVTSCPADDGRATLLAFHYADGSDVDVFVHTSGCSTIANGVIAGVPSPGLLTGLASLTKTP